MEHKPISYRQIASQNPMPAMRLHEVAVALQLDEDGLARRCGMSRSTFYRRKQGKGAFTASELDLLDRHAEIFIQAKAVFEDAEAACSWLQTPQYGLGGVVPLDAIQTTAGFREVEKLLTRIDHGVYA